MKIGILTFQNTINYGALLQGYALNKKINEIDNNCEIIQYQCEAIDKKEQPMEFKNIKNIKDLIKFIMLKKSEENKLRKFKNFTQNYVSYSRKIYCRESIEQLSNDYDLFVVGSDQVWNLNITNGDYTYFLDFEKNRQKKNSYAASFGYEHIPEKYIENSKKYLNEFNNITVREQSGSLLVNELVSKDAPVVLDPTMLLTADEWYEISNVNARKEKYILVYFIHNKKETLKFARKLAKDKGLKLVYINISPKPAFGMENMRDASPEEFISLVKNAEYVITGSFHGTVFSINFNKQFFFEIDKNKGNYNTRIKNIVGLLGLEDRAIIDPDRYTDDTIDYNVINPKLDKLRDDSIEHLKNIILNN